MKNTVKSQIQESIKRFVESIRKERDFITLDEVTYELWGEKFQLEQYEYIPTAGYRTTNYEDRLAVKEILKYGNYMSYASYTFPNDFEWDKHPDLHGNKMILVFKKH